MLKNCFEKIEAQRSALPEGHPARMLGLQLMDICRTDPACAELVAQDLEKEAMSLAACEKKLRAWAGKQKRIDNCVCVPPDVAERIIREFYGLPGLSGEGTDCHGPAGLAMTEGGSRNAEGSVPYGENTGDGSQDSGMLDLLDFM